MNTSGRDDGVDQTYTTAYNGVGLLLALVALGTATLLLLATFWRRTGAATAVTLNKKCNMLVATSSALDILALVPLMVNHVLALTANGGADAGLIGEYDCFRRLSLSLFAVIANRALIVLLTADRFINFQCPMYYKAWPRYYYLAVVACVACSVGALFTGLGRLRFLFGGGESAGTDFCVVGATLSGKTARLTHFVSFLMLVGASILLYATQQLAADSRIVAAAASAQRNNLTSRMSSGFLNLQRFSLYQTNTTTQSNKRRRRGTLTSVVTGGGNNAGTDDLLTPLTIALALNFLSWSSEAFVFLTRRFAPESVLASRLALYYCLVVYVEMIGRPVAFFVTSHQYAAAVDELCPDFGSIGGGVGRRGAAAAKSSASSAKKKTMYVKPPSPATPREESVCSRLSRRRSSASAVALTTATMNYLSVPSGVASTSAGGGAVYRPEKRGSSASIMSAISVTIFGAAATPTTATPGIVVSGGGYGSTSAIDDPRPPGDRRRRKSSHYLHLQTKPPVVSANKRNSVTNLFNYL